MAVVNIDCTIRIGYIYNATYVSTNITTVITYNNSCSECICDGFLSTVPSLYVGLNCYTNNKTCALFANYLLSSSTIKIDLNSIFIFIQQSLSQNTTTESIVPSSSTSTAASTTSPPITTSTTTSTTSSTTTSTTASTTSATTTTTSSSTTSTSTTTVFPPLIGVTVAGYENGTSGLDAMALGGPQGVYVMPNGNIYVADSGNNRVQKFLAGSRLGITLIGNGSAGSTSGQLNSPQGIYVDALTEDVYVADSTNRRILQVSSINITLQGRTVVSSSSSPALGYSYGIRIDTQGNLYVSVYGNRVYRWPVNSTTGATFAGSATAGSDASSFSWPDHIDLDASGKYMYVADKNNHRVQRWQLPFNGSAAGTAGVTVAGGNGAGNLPNQLYQPQGACVSKKTGAVYVADTGNNRVQVWYVNATQGITLAGSSQGVAGSGPYGLFVPKITNNVNLALQYTEKALNAFRSCTIPGNPTQVVAEENIAQLKKPTK
ncbi:unnamed protein product [Adineta steineri]|uniref:NHL repeat containing protein n=1 Tax=Adineta steineri TaxID=433720 RepID=A0A813X2B9_9BILA|nr:unnamed protein product [Adineta steineri]CAF1220847.1 unnamed protein product [Adineta steineri]CAF3942151.1 unnamed protein product [Adineta steineri]CAF4060786.1 unnamed protein product [Adineta steineri]